MQVNKVVIALIASLNILCVTITVGCASHGLELIEVNHQALEVCVPVRIFGIETNYEILPCALINNTVAHNTAARATSTGEDEILIITDVSIEIECYILGTEDTRTCTNFLIGIPCRGHLTRNLGSLGTMCGIVGVSPSMPHVCGQFLPLFGILPFVLCIGCCHTCHQCDGDHY